MNARFYNPTSGRFISQDSYSGSPSEPWTQHLYSYTCNNPVNMIDPTGHLPRTILFDDSGHSYTLHPNVDGYQNTDSQYCNLTIDEEEKNRNSAVAYAEYYCNSISGHDGYEYCHPDCANFVSQCLYAGGFKMTGSWYWKGYKVPNCINGFKTPIDTFKHIFGMKSYDASISWTSAPKLWEYYTKSKYNLGITAVRNARDCTIAANSGKIKPGDIIGFNSNNNGINHMAIVTSVGNGIIGYSAHTFSRDNVDLTTVFGKNPNYGTVNIMSLDYSEN